MIDVEQDWMAFAQLNKVVVDIEQRCRKDLLMEHKALTIAEHTEDAEDAGDKAYEDACDTEDTDAIDSVYSVIVVVADEVAVNAEMAQAAF